MTAHSGDGHSLLSRTPRLRPAGATARAATGKEWQSFSAERTAELEDIRVLRQHVADEEARQNAKLKAAENEDDEDKKMTTEETAKTEAEPATASSILADKDVEMDVENENPPAPASREATEEKKNDEPTTAQADDDDAVEY